MCYITYTICVIKTTTKKYLFSLNIHIILKLMLNILTLLYELTIIKYGLRYIALAGSLSKTLPANPVCSRCAIC